MPYEVNLFEPAQWPRRAAECIQAALDELGRGGERCSVMLTGGRSAGKLYGEWARMPAFREISNVDFYFGDERCVPLESEESNYGLAMQTLFQAGISPGCTVRLMAPAGTDPAVAAGRYGDSLPEAIDLLLLGVGEDGHIASLFPGSAAMNETTRKVVPVTVPKPPAERITVTPSVIASARRVFVLAPGASKARVLAGLLDEPGTGPEPPVRMAAGATWLTDTGLPEAAATGAGR